MSDSQSEPLPCPFCGDSGVTVHEGSTFRWRFAECDSCGARAGEVRAQTLGEGTCEQWEATAKEDAIREWNVRAGGTTRPLPPEPKSEDELTVPF